MSSFEHPVIGSIGINREINVSSFGNPVTGRLY